MQIELTNFCRWSALVASAVLIAGCGGAEEPAAEPEGEVAGTDIGNEGSESSGDSITLNADNTSVSFVGIHTGDDPDPRSGSFPAVSGSASVGDGVLTGLSVKFDVTMIESEADKLTEHLKSADFFNVKEFPEASFESTAIESGDEGTATIRGNMTMLGETQEIEFPATVSTESGLAIEAEFELDRSAFGMNYGLEKIDKMVAMTVKVSVE